MITWQKVRVKVVHASLSSRFGQQDLYSPAIIENLLIYFFQYGPFGGGVLTAIIIVLRVQCDKLPLVVT